MLVTFLIVFLFDYQNKNYFSFMIVFMSILKYTIKNLHYYILY